MSNLRVCQLSAVENRESLKVVLNGRPPLVVWNVQGKIYVTDDTCTHGQASLAEDGTLDNFEVECGLHLGSFDIRTGEVTSAPCTIPLRIYEVVMEDGWVCISICAV